MKHHKQPCWLGSYEKLDFWEPNHVTAHSHYSFLLSACNKNNNVNISACSLFSVFAHYSLCYTLPILVQRCLAKIKKNKTKEDGQPILIMHHSCNAKASFDDDWWENNNMKHVSLRKEALMVTKPSVKFICPNGFWAQCSAVKHAEQCFGEYPPLSDTVQLNEPCPAYIHTYGRFGPAGCS